MSNELALAVSNPVELNKLFGYQGRPKPIIPMLKVNGSDEEEGKTAPKGTFVYDDGDSILYAEECTIRSFTKAYQYRLYDEKVKDNNDMSVIFNDFRQELRSMSGRLACGKMNKRAYQELGDNVSAQQKYLQDNVKCKLLIFGVVSGKFTNVDTKQVVELKDALFSWVVSQSGYMAMDRAITGIEKERRPVPLTEIKLVLKKDKKGSVTYFFPEPSVAVTSVALVPDRDAAYLKRITDFIKDTNAVVNDRYNVIFREINDNKSFASVAKKANDVDDDTIPF